MDVAAAARRPPSRLHVMLPLATPQASGLMKSWWAAKIGILAPPMASRLHARLMSRRKMYRRQRLSMLIRHAQFLVSFFIGHDSFAGMLPCLRHCKMAARRLLDELSKVSRLLLCRFLLPLARCLICAQAHRAAVITQMMPLRHYALTAVLTPPPRHVLASHHGPMGRGGGGFHSPPRCRFQSANTSGAGCRMAGGAPASSRISYLPP